MLLYEDDLLIQSENHPDDAGEDTFSNNNIFSAFNRGYFSDNDAKTFSFQVNKEDDE